ncbi:transglutaminase family protein [Cellulomonas sp. NTE-D12]|uniref:transglutaminase family protein n=1 Tax=Cellulomonas sp. NTE-D12 TaxID=2962632 RepID=UPI00308143A5|nr:hypothetical protein CELD12_13350 [Cellulomonas sp. NTE-D12]
MSRLRIVHTTTFRYPQPVAVSHNEARMTPVDEPGQRVLSTRLDVQPSTWSTTFRDYWGTAVTAFEVVTPHTTLSITAEHVVEVGGRPDVVPVDWDVVRSGQVRDRYAEHLADPPSTQVPDEVVALAVSAAAGLAPDAAARAVCAAVHDAMEYVPGVTTVHTPAAEAWAARTGVCQDLTHLALGALHAIGLPARYVSGYLQPKADGLTGQPVTGESHAWLECWVGAWLALDPTNLGVVADQHVVLARGRSYEDVPPLRGIYAGPAAQELSVQVQVTRQA